MPIVEQVRANLNPFDTDCDEEDEQGSTLLPTHNDAPCLEIIPTNDGKKPNIEVIESKSIVPEESISQCQMLTQEISQKSPIAGYPLASSDNVFEQLLLMPSPVWTSSSSSLESTSTVHSAKSANQSPIRAKKRQAPQPPVNSPKSVFPTIPDLPNPSNLSH